MRKAKTVWHLREVMASRGLLLDDSDPAPTG